MKLSKAYIQSVDIVCHVISMKGLEV